MEEKDRLEILKDILFTDDRQYIEKIAERIEQLDQVVNDHERLTGQVNPIVREQLEDFKENMPKTLGPTITATLKQEIKNHKDEVVDALFPILGKMVQKYVAQEMKILSEKIDNQFSFLKRWKIGLKALFTNTKKEDLLLTELSSANIEQVFLIERGSGILKAGYSRTETIDEEMISGMLTAIKSFVEDAFVMKNQDLEMIEYELYQIHLQSFVTHFVAVVISGNYTTRSKKKVQDLIFNFYNKFMALNLDLVFAPPGTDSKYEVISRKALEKKLEQSFGDAII